MGRLTPKQTNPTCSFAVQAFAPTRGQPQTGSHFFNARKAISGPLSTSTEHAKDQCTESE
jgi:hypothetical protein